MVPTTKCHSHICQRCHPTSFHTAIQCLCMYNRLDACVFVWARWKYLKGIKYGCEKVTGFYTRSVNVWHLLQPPHVFNVNKVMSDINQAAKGLFDSKLRPDIQIDISHTGRLRNKLRTYRTFKHSFDASKFESLPADIGTCQPAGKCHYNKYSMTDHGVPPTGEY